MSTTTSHVTASFMLPVELLEELKECAKAAKCSLNDFVVSILTEAMRKNKEIEI